jgi:hypothetical protein
MVHQDKSLELLIYGCLLSDDDLTTIDCPDYMYLT